MKAMRCLILLTACSMASACTDVEARGSAREQRADLARAADKARDTKPQSLPEPKLASAQLSDPTTALTAMAERPKTIADVPAPKTTQEAAALPGAAALTAHGKEDAEPIDFDRPISAKEVLIDRFVLAHGVAEREPVDESDSFSTDTKKIFAFIQLANPEAAPYAFTVHWEKVDGPSVPYGVKLNVPTAIRHRTWSWTAIEREPGSYRAILRTLAGEEIASRTFVITSVE